jgi:hypothetical protein
MIPYADKRACHPCQVGPIALRVLAWVAGFVLILLGLAVSLASIDLDFIGGSSGGNEIQFWFGVLLVGSAGFAMALIARVKKWLMYALLALGLGVGVAILLGALTDNLGFGLLGYVAVQLVLPLLPRSEPITASAR